MGRALFPARFSYISGVEFHYSRMDIRSNEDVGEPQGKVKPLVPTLSMYHDDKFFDSIAPKATILHISGSGRNNSLYFISLKDTVKVESSEDTPMYLSVARPTDFADVPQKTNKEGNQDQDLSRSSAWPD